MASNYFDFDSCSCHSSISEGSENFSCSSMHSTPSRRGLSDSNSFTVNAIKEHVKRDVKERFATNQVDVAQFVQHALGLKPEDVEAIINAAKEGRFSLPEEDLLCYRAIKEEQDAYKPFLKMSEALIEQVRAILLPEAERRNIFYESRGKCVLKSSNSDRKPDALAIPANHKEGQRITWKDVIAPFEFKTRRLSSLSKIARPSPPSLAASASRLFVPKEEKGSPPLGPPTGNSAGDVANKGRRPSGGPSRSRRNSNADSPISPVSSIRSERSEVTPTQKKVNLNDPSATESVSSTLKRKADDDSGLASPKRPHRTPPITDDQLQLARYAIECMASSSRHYVTGVYVDTFSVSLWYYDRAIVACTAPFNFEKEPGTLALVLYALSVCDLHHAGFDPFVIPPTTPRPSTLDDLFDIPPSMRQSKDDEIIFFKDGAVEHFRIDGKVLFANKALVGRGTVVLPVAQTEGDLTSGMDHVVKMTWRQTKRQKEANLIQQLREAIPGMVQHLPMISAFMDVTADELRLPRKLMQLLYPDDWERELHMIAMKRYKGLWYAKDVNEFKDIFVDCVECHYAAFKRGRVLHRDLSVTNLMCDDAPKRRIGIVADWDLASLIDDQGEIIVSHTQHRTGTIPFMSKELLSSAPPPHKYWHDLESFLYILLWAAVHFDLQTHQHLPPHPVFVRWNHEDLDVACALKDNFFMNPDSSGYYTMLRPELRELMGWIDALATLIGDAYLAVNSGTTRKWDHGTLVCSRPIELFEQRITFESFMSAIDCVPRFTYN